MTTLSSRLTPLRQFDLYPSGDLPERSQPPVNYSYPAWSDSGELCEYADVAAVRPTNTGDVVPDGSMAGWGLMPGESLPKNLSSKIRRAYYAAVSHVDDAVGMVLSSLEG